MCLGPLPAVPSATRQQDTSQPHCSLPTIPCPVPQFPHTAQAGGKLQACSGAAMCQGGWWGQ